MLHSHRFGLLFHQLIDKLHLAATQTIFSILNRFHGLIDETWLLQPVFKDRPVYLTAIRHSKQDEQGSSARQDLIWDLLLGVESSNFLLVHCLEVS